MHFAHEIQARRIEASVQYFLVITEANGWVSTIAENILHGSDESRRRTSSFICERMRMENRMLTMNNTWLISSNNSPYIICSLGNEKRTDESNSMIGPEIWYFANNHDARCTLWMKTTYETHLSYFQCKHAQSESRKLQKWLKFRSIYAVFSFFPMSVYSSCLHLLSISGAFTTLLLFEPISYFSIAAECQQCAHSWNGGPQSFPTE